MVLKEKVSKYEKQKILATQSSNLILILSGFLGGIITALLLSPLAVSSIIMLRDGVGLANDWDIINKLIIKILVVVSCSGVIASELLRCEYTINRYAYKRVSELHVPIVFPFFFLLFAGLIVTLWLQAVPHSFDVNTWITVALLVTSSLVLSIVLVFTWRFFNDLFLSLISPVDWKSVIEVQRFKRHLKTSFAAIKRYPSPLSLTVIEIDKNNRISKRRLRNVQEALVNIISNNIREADAVGRVESGKVLITMTHTGGSGAAIQAKRVKKILNEYLAAREVKEERSLTLSIGIASFTSDTKNSEDLVNMAMSALKQAKEEGGNRLVIHNNN